LVDEECFPILSVLWGQGKGGTGGGVGWEQEQRKDREASQKKGWRSQSLAHIRIWFLSNIPSY
jgi:hypothetical protein